MKIRLTLSIIVLCIASCAGSPQAAIEKRIERVEHGLLSSYDVPPWKTMLLADRMEYYNVPGVSIAVINDFKIEWVKSYGVLEIGSSQPVTPDTIFQTGFDR